MVARRGEEVELGEDGGYVALDRLLGEGEVAGDGGVRPALCDKGEHLTLAVGEPGEALLRRVAPEQAGHDVGVEDGAAAGHGRERIDEGRDIEHAVLEEVAEVAGVGTGEGGGGGRRER